MLIRLHYPLPRRSLDHALGWAHYQVRKDLSIRRHWHLVCCAFSFCWWASTECEDFGSPPVVLLKDDKHPSSCRADEVGGGKKQGSERTTTPLMATGSAEGTLMAGAVRNAHALLESILRAGPASGAEGAVR
jgi:hypothetical protein